MRGRKDVFGPSGRSRGVVIRLETISGTRVHFVASFWVTSSTTNRLLRPRPRAWRVVNANTCCSMRTGIVLILFSSDQEKMDLTLDRFRYCDVHSLHRHAPHFKNSTLFPPNSCPWSIIESTNNTSMRNRWYRLEQT